MSLYFRELEIPKNWNETAYLDWYESCEDYEETFDENDGLFFSVDKAPKSAQAPTSAHLDYWKYWSAQERSKSRAPYQCKAKSAFSWHAEEIRRLKAFLDDDDIQALFTDIRISWLKAPKRPILSAQAPVQAPVQTPKNFLHTYKVWSAHIERLKKRLIQIRYSRAPKERYIPSNLYKAPDLLIEDSRALQKSAQAFMELFRLFRIANFNTGLGSAKMPKRSSNITREDNVKQALKRYRILTDFRSASETVAFLLGEKPETLSFEDLAKKYRKNQALKSARGKDYQVYYYDVWVKEAPRFQQAPVIQALKTVLLPKSSLPEMKFWDSESQTFVDRRDVLTQTSRDVIPLKTWVKSYLIYCGSAQYQQIDVFSYSGKVCLRTYIKQSAIPANSLLWEPRNEDSYQTNQAPYAHGLCNYWFGALEDKAPKPKAPKSAKAPKREKPKNVSKHWLSRYSKSKMK